MEILEKCEYLCEVQITYKNKVKPADRLKIERSEDAYSILKQVYNPGKIEHVEEMFVLLVNRANRVLGWAKISSGGVCGTVCDFKVVFQTAIKANACGIILSHNHPSGNTQPSEADLALTRRLKQAGSLIDVALLDHIIVGDGSYYSLSDQGQI